MGEPVDVPVNKRNFDMVYEHMRYSDKAFMGSVTTAARALDSVAMCRILFGPEFVEQHCVLLGTVNVNSPRVLAGEASRGIRVTRRLAPATRPIAEAPAVRRCRQRGRAARVEAARESGTARNEVGDRSRTDGDESRVGQQVGRIGRNIGEHGRRGVRHEGSTHLRRGGGGMCLG